MRRGGSSRQEAQRRDSRRGLIAKNAMNPAAVGDVAVAEVTLATGCARTPTSPLERKEGHCVDVLELTLAPDFARTPTPWSVMSTSLRKMPTATRFPEMPCVGICLLVQLLPPTHDSRREGQRRKEGKGVDGARGKRRGRGAGMEPGRPRALTSHVSCTSTAVCHEESTHTSLAPVTTLLLSVARSFALSLVNFATLKDDGRFPPMDRWSPSHFISRARRPQRRRCLEVPRCRWAASRACTSPDLATPCRIRIPHFPTLPLPRDIS